MIGSDSFDKGLFALTCKIILEYQGDQGNVTERFQPVFTLDIKRAYKDWVLDKFEAAIHHGLV